MKNIFKMMGVALLACSMIMVSCKKDEEDTTTNNGGGNNGGGNGGGTTTTAVVKIYWDNAEQTLGFTNSLYNSQLGIAMLEAGKALNGDTPEPPYFVTYYAPVTTGQLYLAELVRVSETSDSTIADYGFDCEVLEEGYVTIGEGDDAEDYPDYQYMYTLNTSVFGHWDANTQTVDNSDMHILFANTESYIQAIQTIMGEEGVTSPSQISNAGWESISNSTQTKELNIKLVNYKFGE